MFVLSMTDIGMFFNMSYCKNFDEYKNLHLVAILLAFLIFIRVLHVSIMILYCFCFIPYFCLPQNCFFKRWIIEKNTDKTRNGVFKLIEEQQWIY